MVFRLGAYESKPIPRERCVTQGGPLSAEICNAVFEDAWLEFESIGLVNGWGYRLCEQKRANRGFPLLGMSFADSFWLLANSNKELERMFRCWLRVLLRRGWKAPTSECCRATTLPDHVSVLEKVTVGSEVAPHRLRAQGIDVLGTLI